MIWEDMRGVWHIAFWGTSERHKASGYHLLCSGNLLVPRQARHVEPGHPTCVRCVVAQ